MKMANRELTKGFISSKIFIPDVKSKYFTREQTQAIRSFSTNHCLIDKNNKFDFTDSKMEKKFMYEHHQWTFNKKIMDINSKRDKSPETLQLIGKRREITNARPHVVPI